MAVATTNLGVITAYGDAVAAGYTGTKAEWQALMASYATVGQQAVDAKNDAVAAKNTAVSKATEATTAANTATTKASEASASAQSIAQSAAQIQENTDDIGQLKSDLNGVYKNELIAKISASGNTWYQYNFIAGHKYAFINTGASTLIPETVSNQGSYEQIEQIGTSNLQTAVPTYFVPQYSAPYLWVYSSGVGSFKLYEVDALFEVENNVDSNLTALNFEEDFTFTTGSGDVSPLITGEAVVISQSAYWNYALVDMTSSDYVIARVYTSSNARILYFVWVDGNDVAISADVFNITTAKSQLLRSKKPIGASKVYVRNYNSYDFKIWKSVSTPLQVQVSKNTQDIKNVYENSVDSSLSASGNVWIEFAIRAGHRYKFTNSANSSGVLLCYSTAANGSYENIETFTGTGNIASGGFLYVTATYDAPYLRVYANGAAEFTVEEITTVNWLVDRTDAYFVDLPSYYTEAYLSGIIDDINNLTYDGYDSSFVFITDMHVYKNKMNSARLIEYISKHVQFPFVMYGGDTCMAYASDRGIQAKAAVLADRDEWNVKFANVLAKAGIPLFNVHGNHDWTIAASPSDRETGWTAPNGLTTQQTTGKNSLIVHGEPSKAYYYFDDTVAKIRYIVLDQWYVNTVNTASNTVAYGIMASGDTTIEMAQYAWLIDALNVDGYDIVVFTHASPNPDLTSSIPTAGLWKLLKTFKEKGSSAYGDAGGNILWQADFTEYTSDLAFIMSGHTHFDQYGVKDGILSIVTTCDCYVDDDPNVDRVQNTTSEQAFDFVLVNKTAKTVKTVRIGGGDSRAWNYSTGQLIT